MAAAVSVVFVASCLLHVTARPEVTTAVGVIVGFHSEASFSDSRKPVTQFLGIPYAEEPTGQLRFSKPAPKAAFVSPFNASSFGAACPQNMYTNLDRHLTADIKEDCLNLNIYVPGNVTPPATRSANLPVMIWIHGGGFAFGAGKYYDGSVLSGFLDVIVVTINYRLSVFGFLSTGDAASPGNFGLWDQRLAVKWVHENIAAFGGDNSRITVAGESAGSASAYYQATYPGNKGLFQRIIAESGVSLSPWAFTGDDQLIRSNLAYYATHINCSLSDKAAFVNCLRDKTTEELMVALWKTNDVIHLGNRFTPVVDGEFILKSPHALFDSLGSSPEFEMYKSVGVLTGVNSFDGTLYSLAMWNRVVKAYANITINTGVPRQVFETVIVPNVTRELYFRLNPSVVKAIVSRYTDSSDPDNMIKTRSSLMDLTNDFTFFVPTITAINKHCELDTGASNQYFYQFSHRSSFMPYADWITGAGHADELFFVFGFPDRLWQAFGLPVGPKPTQGEVRLASNMMVYWTNFIKSGDPNFPVKLSTVQWPHYDNSTQAYIDFTINMSPSSVKSKLIPQRYAFWEVYIPKLLRS